jgi:hypothetical protein
VSEIDATKEGSMGNKLHVWTADREEWVVAESATDACAVYCAHVGCEPSENAAEADWGTHPDHWTPLPDDEPLRIGDECPECHKIGVGCVRCNNTGVIRTVLACEQYVQRAGRSYIGSANY